MCSSPSIDHKAEKETQRGADLLLCGRTKPGANTWVVVKSLMFMFLCSTAGGCSIPRSIHMTALAKDELRLPPQGQHVVTETYPWFSEPSASKDFETSHPADAVADWYKEEMPKTGWRITRDYSRTNEDGRIQLRFEREVGWTKYFGSIDPEHQTLDLTFTPSPHDTGTKARLYLYCTVVYVWDIPTDLVFSLLLHTFGEQPVPYYGPLFYPF